MIESGIKIRWFSSCLPMETDRCVLTTIWRRNCRWSYCSLYSGFWSFKTLSQRGLKFVFVILGTMYRVFRYIVLPTVSLNFVCLIFYLVVKTYVYPMSSLLSFVFRLQNGVRKWSTHWLTDWCLLNLVRSTLLNSNRRVKVLMYT